jgi:hypothetical protein
MTEYCSRGKPDGGGATAEFAVLMPAFAGLLVLLIGIAAQQGRGISLQEKLGSLARLVESGQNLSTIRQAGKQLGLSLDITESGGLVCLATEVPVSVLGVTASTQRLTSCGLAPGE